MKRANLIKVAILAGGNSSEAQVSLRSATEVYNCLDRELFDPHIMTINAQAWTVDGETVDKNDFSTPSKGRFDYALVMIHGTPGENGILQGYLELMSIPYSSCGVGVSALTFDKTLCKMALRDTEGMHFAREIVVGAGDKIDPQLIAQTLGLPLFVKPNASGSSCGVSKITSVDLIYPAIEKAFTESNAVLCEEFIEGVEISQGVMFCGDEQYVLPITELVSKKEFFDYEAKYTPGMTDEITPARLPQNVAQTVSQATKTAYKRLGCRGVVRFDYIVKGDKAYFIEVNTVPGMSQNSIIPQQWRHIGMTMQQAFTKIIISTSKR